MAEWRPVSKKLQLAAYLRAELQEGRWQGRMPGVIRLARELGASRDLVEEALRELEHAGVLHAQGPGRGRAIGSGVHPAGQRRFRVTVLAGDAADRNSPIIYQLVRALQDAGHLAGVAGKTLAGMNDKPGRVARFVEQSATDAWVVMCATRPVLEWFAQGPRPAFALAGRANRIALPSVAPDKLTPMRAALRHLVELGHRRIVLMSRPIRRIPDPGLTERTFLNELEAQGVVTGRYNLPDWTEGVEGYQAGLRSLFRTTPPTAMLLDEALFVVPTLQFCMANGLRIPQDVSLISTDPDPAFMWSHPPISHIRWDLKPMIRRIVRWADKASRGQEDPRKSLTKGSFVEGATIGPVPKGR
ncbi:substrate-binding domain-containing protein [Haloferula sp. A504]|uniref:substrate-binding domain-containing protein n=1 Tax=Haloferula sp. A504 TaxID=3373601 RepID=UPI0031C7BF49|nr:substrate-binding domain-containing protein [Verrucomicrobiaceae bacterium E54]